MARLLIVEDTPELAALIASVARSRGHSTETCQSGAAALELAARQPPELAIVDLLLPDVGGKEVLRELKERGIRTIAISGVFKGAPFHQEATSELGALAFFEKPFEMKALLDAVERFVGPGTASPPESAEDDLEELEVLSPLEDDVEEPVLVLEDEVPGPAEEDPRFAALPEGDEDLTDVPTATIEVDPALIAATVPPAQASAPPPPQVQAPASEEATDLGPAEVSSSSPEAVADAVQPPEAAAFPEVAPAAPAAMAEAEMQPGRPEVTSAAPGAVAGADAQPAPSEVPSAAPTAVADAEAQPAPPEVVSAARGAVTGGEVRPPESQSASSMDPAETRAPAGAAVWPPSGSEAPLPLPFAERERVWSKPEQAAKKAGQRELPEWSQAGDLATTSVPRLLTAYYQASHGGELKLRQGDVNKVVYFEEGQPVYAASNLASERFARFCVRKGAITQAQVAQVAQQVRERGLRSGEAMLQLGLLTPQKRQALLEAQVREIIWSTFSWTTGQYTFSPRRPARTDLVKLRVFPGNLILQGVQRTQPLVALRTRMPPTRRLHPSPDPPYALHDLELTGQQALLLAYADGSKTVEDLLTLLDLPEKDALATLVGLELMGVLVERQEEGKRRRITFGL